MTKIIKYIAFIIISILNYVILYLFFDTLGLVVFSIFLLVVPNLLNILLIASLNTQSTIASKEIIKLSGCIAIFNVTLNQIFGFFLENSPKFSDFISSNSNTVGNFTIKVTDKFFAFNQAIPVFLLSFGVCYFSIKTKRRMLRE